MLSLLRGDSDSILMCRRDRADARRIAHALSWRGRDQIFPEHADARKVAVTFHVIESVADHEFVRDLETDIVGFHHADAGFLLVQQDADTDAQRTKRLN